VKPDPPVWAAQEIEDNFNRVATRSKYTSSGSFWPGGVKGEGLGADGVWTDSYPSYPAGNGSKIGSTESEAIMPQGAFATAKEVPLYPHSYVEANFRVLNFDNDTGGYNFDVHGRVVGSGANTQGYFAKVTYILRGADVPTILVGRLVGTSIDEFPGSRKRICQNNCTCVGDVPLSSGGSVWLQLETQDSSDPDGVVVIGRIGWSCDSCNSTPCDFSKCGGFCETSWLDQDAFGVALKEKVGSVGMDAHEGTYSIDTFRGGSGPN
jgi:hypothetical protein